MIYLDAAATSLQKPYSVPRAVQSALLGMTTPGRGGYASAQAAADTVFQCRKTATRLFHVPSEEQVVFTFNATHALNIAIHAIVKPGSHVVISGFEHNAVLRPLAAIENVVLQRVGGVLFDGIGLLRAFDRAVSVDTTAVVCTQVSNVFGFVLPIYEIAALCRQRHVPLIIDASQAAGVLPIDFIRSGAAFTAMAGHKGLLGPQGTGILLCREESVEPLLYGGTGSMSILRQMPPYLPDRLEAGTQNMPGVAGLLEGLRFVEHIGTEKILDHERKLTEIAGEALKKQMGAEVFLAEDMRQQSGVLSFRIQGESCESIAAFLAAEGIAVRAGLHCAPEAHHTAGTLNTGTIRISPSIFNTPGEVQIFLSTMNAYFRRKRGKSEN